MVTDCIDSKTCLMAVCDEKLIWNALRINITGMLSTELADTSKGYAIIRVRQLDMKAYLIYVPNEGIRVVFRDSIECGDDQLDFCKKIADAAIKWGIVKEDEVRDNVMSAIKKIINRFER